MHLLTDHGGFSKLQAQKDQMLWRTPDLLPLPPKSSRLYLRTVCRYRGRTQPATYPGIRQQ